MSFSRSQLLSEILVSSDLYVMQIEMDVYTLAKKVCVCVWVCIGWNENINLLILYSAVAVLKEEP